MPAYSGLNRPTLSSNATREFNLRLLNNKSLNRIIHIIANYVYDITVSNFIFLDKLILDANFYEFCRTLVLWDSKTLIFFVSSTHLSFIRKCRKREINWRMKWENNVKDLIKQGKFVNLFHLLYMDWWRIAYERNPQSLWAIVKLFIADKRGLCIKKYSNRT